MQLTLQVHMDILQNWRQTLSGEHLVKQEKSLKFWLTLEIFGNTNEIKLDRPSIRKEIFGRYTWV